MKGYTTYGSVRGGCGHSHRSADTAAKCLLRDHANCKAAGGYSDRCVCVIGRDGRLYYDEECARWVPMHPGSMVHAQA